MENTAQKLKEEREARRNEVFEFMKSIGPYSVPANTLAEKHNCTVKTIYNDRDYWIKRIKFKDISLEGKKILMSLMRNMAITEELKAKGEVSERLRAIMASNNTAEVFTKILEQYGFKEKVADKIEYEGDQVLFQLVEMSDQEEKDEKEKHRKNIEGKKDHQGQPEANADSESPRR